MSTTCSAFFCCCLFCVAHSIEPNIFRIVCSNSNALSTKMRPQIRWESSQLKTGIWQMHSFWFVFSLFHLFSSSFFFLYGKCFGIKFKVCTIFHMQSNEQYPIEALKAAPCSEAKTKLCLLHTHTHTKRIEESSECHHNTNFSLGCLPIGFSGRQYHLLLLVFFFSFVIELNPFSERIHIQ